MISISLVDNLSQDGDASLELSTDRRRFEVVPSPVASSNPWVPIIPTTKKTKAPPSQRDSGLRSGSSSSKKHLPRSNPASHREAPKWQQYQDRPPKSPRKRPPPPHQPVRARQKPRRHIKLVLERQKPLFNLLPNRRKTVKLLPRPKVPGKSLRPPPRSLPNRFAF